MGNTPAVQRIGELDEKEKAKRVQLPYENLIENSDIEYSVDPSFKLRSATTSSIQKAPIQESHKAIINPTSTNKIDLPALKPNEKTNAVKDTSTDATTALGYEIVRAIERNEGIVRGISDILINNIKGKNKLIVELSKEEQAKLNDLIKQLGKKENADTVKSILNVLTASTAIVAGTVILAPAAGATLAATTTLWGILLIASGVTNLISNEVLPRIGGFEKIASFFTSDENKKQDLADNIQTATSITSTILSITSALATSPLLGSVLSWGQGAKVLDVGLGLASGGANLVKDVGEYQFKNAQGEQTLIESRLKQEKNDLENTHLTMQSSLDVQKAFNTISNNIVYTLNEVSQKDSRTQKTSNATIEFEIANTAAESIKALNTNLANRFIHIFNSTHDSKESSLKAAKSQSNQAIPHGLSAVVSFTCAIATSVLTEKGFAHAASFSDAVAKAGPQGADFASRMMSKTSTIENDKTRFSEYDKQTKSNAKDNISSTIARTAEMASRLMQAASAG